MIKSFQNIAKTGAVLSSLFLSTQFFTNTANAVPLDTIEAAEVQARGHLETVLFRIQMFHQQGSLQHANLVAATDF